MSHDQLTIDIRVEREGETVIFRLRGSFDIATSPSVRAALLEAANEGKHDIIVDLSQVEFLDSTGLGALVGGHRRALENGGTVRLVATDGPIGRLLNITGLVRVFPVYRTLADALADQGRVLS
jgi:anti-sigma B factor antagonist